MAKIVKLWAKQTVNNALYHRNGPNTTLVHDLPLNSEVLVWRESGSWNGPYCLLAVENETCCVQFLSGLISFKSMSIKPYFWSKNTYDAKLNELEAPIKLDKLETPTKPDKLETLAKPDKLKALLPIL